MAKMQAKHYPRPKPVRLRTVLKAIRTRRAKGGRMTQADYTVALDKIVRAIGRSQHAQGPVVVHAVQVL